ncbi:ROK family protein [Salisediminibacterium beveridgei]|uniref:Sugar kinase, NBD/HSP70 family n=1 Tax=Salisediminibacterium beveridgei TaxID=632773 RepID=A0A1D7QZA6_9BACI|nr:ROK family protein [Salisediminibacterium beveridgei]AOM84338.1 sugar kinase, NBD/HSP70 family [Salisediminibacterium beveridgei]
MTSTLYLTFDIGGTAVKWGLIDANGQIHSKASFSSNEGSGQAILNGMNDIITKQLTDVKGIAISAPGFVNPDGYLEYGGAIQDFNDFQMKRYFEERFERPITIENDVNCVALAEQWLGNGQDLTDFICMTVGTGIGGALILNGRLYRGHNFRSGEFGHMITHGLHKYEPMADGLSDQASIYVIRRKYAAYQNLSVKDVTGEMVFEAYDGGDPTAVHIVNQFYERLAVGIYNITAILNPEKILVGGGITSRPTFITELRNHLSYVDRAFNPPVETCHFRNDAGLIGAMAFHKLSYPGHR